MVVIEAARQISETGPIGPNADPEVLRKAREIARDRVEIDPAPLRYRYRVGLLAPAIPRATHLYEDGLRGGPLPDIKTDTQIISEGLTALQDIGRGAPPCLAPSVDRYAYATRERPITRLAPSPMCLSR